jgi:hypothetical protein
MEQMLRSQVTAKPTEVRNSALATIPKPIPRVEISQDSLEVATTTSLDHNLLLASNGENHVQDKAKAAGWIGGE